MNWDLVAGNWKLLSGVKAQWGRLTDDYLDVIAGKRDESESEIQEAYGISTDEAEMKIRPLEERHRDT